VKVLVLAALTDATGNAVTARRIAKLLQPEHEVTLVDTTKVSIAELKAMSADAAIALHALLAGPFVRALDIPYALIFGGTDLYERTHALQQAQMSKAVAQAARLVAFSPENRARAEWMWPSTAGRVTLLPQAVELPALDEGFSLRKKLRLRGSDLLAVLPTGIRRVKDPLHVVEAMSVWHVVHPRVQLAIAGAVLEPDYAEEALRLMERPGVHVLSPLPRAQMLAAMREADVVLNTSLSEGMCGALLEAMALGAPVVARRNAGNESLVVHGHTGLLYDAPHELVHWVGSLAASPELRQRLAATARSAAETTHDTARERDAYLQLVEGLKGAAKPAAAAASPIDELEVAVPAGERLGLEAPLLDAVREMVKRIYADEALLQLKRELAGMLGTAPPSVAIAEIRRARVEEQLGRDGARTFYLLLGLLQVPAAEARLAARGVEPDVIDDTLRDFARWAHALYRHTGVAGTTLETLEWAQRYLRGELFQVGAMQFALSPFTGPLRAWRDGRAVHVASLDGRRIDTATGEIGDEHLTPGASWELVLEPGTPMLEMWMPASVPASLREIGANIKRAYALFSRLSPETPPRGVFGESWRLDPALVAALPKQLGLGPMLAVCRLYPASWSEGRVLRRLFWPDLDRAALATVPREKMDAMQQAVADFLSNPDTTLRARSGFVLREDVEALPEWA
jgi:glycosyltransferase involved in cell wall biosynthesis